MMKKLIFLLILMIYGTDWLYASHITMVANTKLTMGPDWIEIELTIMNRGDEDSLVVYPTISLGDKKLTLKSTAYIAFNGSHKWTHRFEIKDLGFQKTGIYPLLLMISYHDANMYPFSMPDVIRVNYGGRPVRRTQLQGKLEFSDIKTKGAGIFTLSNPVSHAVSGQYQLFLPNELAVNKNKKGQFRLNGGETQEIKFQVQNQGALQGSTYRVFGIAEFIDDKGDHATFMISQTLKITEPIIEKNNQNQVIGGLIFIFILFLITAYLEFKNEDKT